MEDEPFVDDEGERDICQSYTSLPYGLQLLHEYVSPSKHCDFQGVIHNNKTNDYIILDSRGVSSWRVNGLRKTIKRSLDFEAYKFNSIRSLVYSRSYNVYFALTKDYGIKVYNLNFHEICCTSSDGSSVSRLLYNTKKNELITVCRDKLRFWRYSIRERNSSFHGITMVREFKVAESLMLSNAEFDEDLQRIYLMSDNNIYCYTIEGRCLFHLKGNAIGYFCSCAYSKEANLFIAGNINGQISIFNLTGGLVTTLLNHSNIVTAIVIHPADGYMFFSASLDGTIKLFSLQMLGEIYSVCVFPEGVLFMKIPSKNVMYAASRKSAQVYNLNYTFQFWSTSRSPVRRMNITQQLASIRRYVVVFTEDYSVRLYNQKTGQRRSTILPPPEIAIGEDVLSIAFDRLGRAMYILFQPLKMWIYSTRTDPATRVAIWDLEVSIKASKVYKENHATKEIDDEVKFGASSISQKQEEGNIRCHSLLIVNRNIFIDEGPEGEFLNFGFLFCGLSNGTICILNPCDKGSLFKTFQGHSTSPVIDMQVDYRVNECHLLTLLDTINGLLVRIWNLQTMTCFRQFHLQQHYTQFLYKNYQFVVGYNSGYLYNEVVQSSVLNDQSEIDTPGTLMKDHDGAILSVDIFANKQFFCSCGTDKYVRVWDSNKTLITEIKFDETLKYAVFLDHFPRILISFKSQLFVIPHFVVFNKSMQLAIRDDVSSGDESFIFEDPLVRSETEASKQRGKMLTTLASYLVPYPNLGLESLWMLQGTITDALSEEEQNSDGDLSVVSRKSSLSSYSFASTAIYQDSVDSSFEEEEINFPRCNGSPGPVPSVTIIPDDPLDSDVDLPVTENDEVSGEKQVELKRSKDSLATSTHGRRGSLYDLLRKKTESVPSSSTLIPKSPTKTSSNAVATNTMKAAPTARSKKKKAKARQLKTKANKLSTTKVEVNDFEKQKSEDQDLIQSFDGRLSQNENDIGDSIANIDKRSVYADSSISDSCNAPTVILTEETVLDDADLQNNDENNLNSVSQQQKLAAPFSVLLSMATGKSERVVSDSYQKVMTSLINSGSTSPVPTVHSVHDSCDEGGDDEGSAEYVAEQPLVSGYEADYDDWQRITKPATVRPRASSVVKSSTARKQEQKVVAKTASNDRAKALTGSYHNQQFLSSSQKRLATKAPVKRETQRKSNSNKDVHQTVPSKITITCSSSSSRSQINKERKSSIDQTNLRSTSAISKDSIEETPLEVTSPSSAHRSRSNLTSSTVLSPSLHNMQPVEVKTIDFSVSLDIKDGQNNETSYTNQHSFKEANEISEMENPNPPHRLRKIVQSTIQEKQPKNDFTSMILHLSARMKNKQKQKQEPKYGLKRTTSAGNTISSAEVARNSNVISSAKTADTSNVISHAEISSAEMINVPHVSKVTVTKSRSSIDIHLEGSDDNNNSIIETSRLPLSFKHFKGDSKTNDSVDTVVNLNEPITSTPMESEFKVEPTPISLQPAPQPPSLHKRMTLSNITSSDDLLVTATSVNMSSNNEKNLAVQQEEESQETHSVVKFILSSFKKPKSATKKERVQFKLSNEDIGVEIDHVEKANNSELKADQYINDSSRIEKKIFITPKNSETSITDYSPVSSVMVRHHSSELTSDESALFRNRSSLYDKLQKHRKTKEKQKARYESIHAKRSASSGYDTTSRDYLLDSEISMRSGSSQSRQRLSVKRSPLYFDDRRSVTPDISTFGQRNSEVVYFEDYLPVARPIESQSRKTYKGVKQKAKEEKIRNLEHKLSGQNHRCHVVKSIHEIEADRLALLMLKKKTGVRLPVGNTSVSIPGRFPHEIIQEHLSSNERKPQQTIMS